MTTLLPLLLAAALAQEPALEHAVVAARAGEYARALELLQPLAAANPRDHEVRLWIGRVHLWMGRPDLAEPVFRAVMLEDGAHTGALLGVAGARLAHDDASGALEVLRRAEQIAPADADVLAAMGRALLRAGNRTEAVGYLSRAWERADTPENRMALEDALRTHRHRVEASGFAESFSPRITSARAGDVSVSVRVTDALRVSARGQVQRKFGLTDERIGAGIEWSVRPATLVAAQFSAGPDNVVLPQSDGQVEVTHTRRRLELTAGARGISFAGARVWVLSPGAAWWATDRLSTGVRYYLSLSGFPTVVGVQESHSVSLRANYRLRPRIWISGGYAHGIENFETLTVERIGAFSADTWSAGARLDLRSLSSIAAAYEHQRRSDAITMHRITITAVQRF